MSAARDVVLQVDELLGPRPAGAFDGTSHSGASGSSVASSTTGSAPGVAPSPKPARRAASAPAARPSAMHAPSAKVPLHGAGRALGLHRRAGHEAGPVVVEARLASRLRVQVDDRAPPAGHRDEVAAEWRSALPVTPEPCRVAHHHFHGVHCASPPSTSTTTALSITAMPGIARALGQRAVRRGRARPRRRPPRCPRRRDRAPSDTRCRCW